MRKSTITIMGELSFPDLGKFMRAAEQAGLQPVLKQGHLQIGLAGPSYNPELLRDNGPFGDALRMLAQRNPCILVQENDAGNGNALRGALLCAVNGGTADASPQVFHMEYVFDRKTNTYSGVDASVIRALCEIREMPLCIDGQVMADLVNGGVTNLADRLRGGRRAEVIDAMPAAEPLKLTSEMRVGGPLMLTQEMRVPPVLLLEEEMRQELEELQMMAP